MTPAQRLREVLADVEVMCLTVQLEYDTRYISRMLRDGRSTHAVKAFKEYSRYDERKTAWKRTR